MSTQDASAKLVRTSVLIPEDVDAALRDLCEGKRPLSWEIREALERHVERASRRLPVKGETSAALDRAA